MNRLKEFASGSSEQDNPETMTENNYFVQPRWQKILSSVLILVFAVVIVAVPASFFGTSINRLAILIVINIIAVIGIGVYSGNSGILSIGHVAFYAIGAYVSGLLTTSPEIKMQFLPNLPHFLLNIQIDFIPAMVIVVIVMSALGFLTGLPMSRLRDSSAVIATFALLVITHFSLIGAKTFTNGSKAFYGVDISVNIWIALVLLAMTLSIALIFKESKAGLQLRASREDETAAKSVGVPVNRRLLEGWIISACILGVAGALFAHTIGAFSPSSFYLIQTFSLIAMLIVGGLQSISGAVFGTILISVLIEFVRNLESGFTFLGKDFGPLWGLTQFCLSGIILLVLYLRPSGLIGNKEVSFPFLNNLWSHLNQKKGFIVDSIPVSKKQISSARNREGSFAANSIIKNFFGLTALNDVSIDVKPGQIVGLIGPNGAGKTTLINCVTGAIPLTGGKIFIDKTDVTNWNMQRIALFGLGRTFQNIRLFKGLTVLENIMISITTRLDRADSSPEESAVQLLTEFKLQRNSNQLAGNLPYGSQRELEIIRALAIKPRYMLLDEPAAGMNRAETGELLKYLHKIRQRYNMGILIVEHDLHLIMKLCDRVIVINKGKVIADGKPMEIQRSPEVIEAYLGTKNYSNN